MITLSHIFLSFGEQEIFHDLSCSFELDHKIGIVGRNGAGKSTLLKVIAGFQKPDSGAISKSKECTIAYLPQEVVLQSTKNVFDEACIHVQKFLDMEQEKIHIEHALHESSDDADTLLDRYSTILETLTHFDRHKAEQEVHTILDGLGFSQAQKAMPVEQLSVGWKMRLVLAQLLLQKADFYLFDEPTNHLDIVTKQWFFEFLRNNRTGYLLISHDRYFLEHACDKILELERAHGTLYQGNLSAYIKQKEEQQAIQLAAYNRQQREIEKKQATIDRFRASASKAGMAQSMIKQLEKIERIEITPPMPTITIKFPPITQSASQVLELQNISHRFDEKPLFHSISGAIQRGERVALVAANGMGKTTLFNLICGKYGLQTGSCVLGNNVSMGVFEQDQTRALKAENTIIDEISQGANNHSEQTIRTFLGSFLFPADDIYKKIKVLSGGEKNRVAMIKVLLSNANFLLLDEPTNHLDMYAQEVLVSALEKYKGTILFVSHDHVFIQRLATRIVELTSAGLHSYPGSYELYLMQKKQQRNSSAASAPSSQQLAPKQKPTLSDKEQSQLKKTIHQLEQSISKLEKERDALGLQLSTLKFGTPDYQSIMKRLQAIDTQLNQYTEQWEQLLS